MRASFRLEDIDGVHPGRIVEVKFLSIHDRTLPILIGRIRNVSADSLEEQRSGVERFTVDIIVPERQIATLVRLRGADTGVRPGVPVQVTVPLAKRTALDYLIDPLRQAFKRSFHER